MSETGIIKRSVVIAGHRTSVSLEEPFWCALQGLAARRGLSVAALIGSVDSARKGRNLSSALRILVLEDALAKTGA
jgi:predicted DNA-binding ribbon-helix-helix protein